MDCIKFIYNHSTDFKIKDLYELNKRIEKDVNKESELNQYTFSELEKDVYLINDIYNSIKPITDEETYLKIISEFVEDGWLDLIFTEEYGDLVGYRVSKNKIENLKFLAIPENEANGLSDSTLI
jgi:hypothetical protein